MTPQTNEDSLRAQIESLSKRLATLEERIKSTKDLDLPVANDPDKVEATSNSIDDKLDQITAIVDEVKKLRTPAAGNTISPTGNAGIGSQKPENEYSPELPPTETLVPNQLSPSIPIQSSAPHTEPSSKQGIAEKQKLPSTLGVVVVAAIIMSVIMGFVNQIGHMVSLELLRKSMMLFPYGTFLAVAGGAGSVVAIPLIAATIGKMRGKSFLRCYVSWQWWFIGINVLIWIAKTKGIG